MHPPHCSSPTHLQDLPGGLGEPPLDDQRAEERHRLEDPDATQHQLHQGAQNRVRTVLHVNRWTAIHRPMGAMSQKAPVLRLTQVQVTKCFRGLSGSGSGGAL
jgi:phage terminase Nu1 subunit (DNA packaging protein)